MTEMERQLLFVKLAKRGANFVTLATLKHLNLTLGNFFVREN